MEKTTFICDWCSTERTESEERGPAYILVQRDGWITGLPVDIHLRNGQERSKISEIFLFPPEMRQPGEVVEGTVTKPSHFESTLCAACVEALQDAVVATRTHRKKRPAKTS